MQQHVWSCVIRPCHILPQSAWSQTGKQSWGKCSSHGRSGYHTKENQCKLNQIEKHIFNLWKIICLLWLIWMPECQRNLLNEWVSVLMLLHVQHSHLYAQSSNFSIFMMYNSARLFASFDLCEAAPLRLVWIGAHNTTIVVTVPTFFRHAPW